MVRIAVRNESVRLTLDDQFTSGMARAAAAAALLKKNLDGLDGTTSKTTSSTEELGESTSKTTKKTQEYSLEIAIAEEKSARLRKALRDQARASLDAADGLAVSAVATKNVGASSDQSGKQIDRLSGRLALLAQAASVLGPALVPLGAPLVGVMSGLTMQLGAVAGAVGVSVLAFKGLGDGMKALNEFQLEPTAENLVKFREEMQKIGPAGRQFILFLDDLDPQLRSLQRAARNGLLPGVEEGITNLLPMLPQVRTIIKDISLAMGDLAGDAGADLAGPEWASFFDYLENEAGPILTEFGQTVGNFAQGFAGLLVGLAPLTDDFSGGLLGMSEAFAEWSAGLATNNSFQEFVSYIQDSGPEAVAMLGQLAVTFGQIIAAAAPVGDAILPVLTKVLDIVGDLADSPLGALFFTAAAGLSVYSRAAALAAGTTKRLGLSAATTGAQVTASNRAYAGMVAVEKNFGKIAAGAGIVALSMTDLDEKAGVSNTAMLTLAGSMAGPWGAAAGAAVGVTMDVAAANDNLAAAVKNAYAALESGDIGATTANLETLRAQVAATDDALSEGLSWKSLSPVGTAKQVFTGINELFSNDNAEAKDSIGEIEGGLRDLEMQAARLKSNMAGGVIPKSARDDMFNAARAAEDLAASLARVNGLLDRRGSWRDYEAAVDAASQSIKDNGRTLDINTEAGRANQATLDDIAATANRLAENMKGTNRVRVLAAARKDFVDTATKMGMGRKAAQELADKLGLLGRVRATPTVEVNTGDSASKISRVQQALNALRNRTVYIDTVQRRMDLPFGNRPGAADGATVPKTGLPYADRHLYMLADGEEVVSNRRGQADMNRAALKAANAGARLAVVGGLASGGTAGGSNGPRSGGTNLMTPSGIAPFLFDPLTTSMRGLRRELSRSEKAVERERNQRDALISKRNDVASGIRDGLGGDIWAGASNPWSAGATSNPTDMLQQQTAQAREFTRLVQSLKSKGLDGAALAEVIGSGDIERARMMAALPASALRQFERAYNVNQQAMASAGAAGGQAAYGAQIAESNRELRGLRAEVKALRQEAKSREGKDDKSRDRAAKKAADSQRRGAAQGFRNRANG